MWVNIKDELPTINKDVAVTKTSGFIEKVYFTQNFGKPYFKSYRVDRDGDRIWYHIEEVDYWCYTPNNKE